MTENRLAETIAEEARRLGVESAALAAVIEVESAGRMTARIDGRDEPVIRFEGHWFDRRLSGARRAAARAAGLADPKAGAVKNPAAQAARWALLERAMRIDRAAALESVSWGAGQVMGGNWKMLGYASVDALVAEARAGAAGQVRLMARFIDAAGLAPALRTRDWTAFARGYNGPGFRANAYDRKLAAAYARRAARSDAPAEAERGDNPLRLGARGAEVEALQARLAACGHFVTVDGVFGRRTQAALLAFQRARGLGPDGIAGPATLAALDDALPASRLSRLWRRLAAWLRAWVEKD